MDMRIQTVANVYGAYQSKGTSGVKRGSKVEEKRDALAVSTQAQDYQAIRKALANTPDIREDKVAHIKSLMDAGRYQVTANDVAGKLVADFLC